MDSDLLKFLEAHFASQGWTWSLKGRGHVIPTQEDFRKTLDAAVTALYAEGDEGGNTVQTGRLIIIKNDEGFDVYVMAGTVQGEK